MVKKDITRNFEFVHVGAGKRADIDKDKDAPLDAMKNLGGRERVMITEKGIERVENVSTQSDYEFRVIIFPGKRIRAYVTSETFPDSKESHGEKPSYATRIRLANYDLESEEEFTRKVSLTLDELPRIS